MVKLQNLEQLAAFAEYGTLSKASEELHISQPSITRTMRLLEKELGVPLFIRSANKIELNDTGKYAARHAQELLRSAAAFEKNIRDYDRSLRTITVESCAPAPLWTLLPELTGKYPSMNITSGLSEQDSILQHVKNSSCDLGIILFEVFDEDIVCSAYMKENLNICLPADHQMLEHHPRTLSFHEIDGFNCLLRSEIGFWEDLCHRKMPSSRFLVQDNDFEFQELVEHSTLPFFSTNLGRYSKEAMAGRVEIPISDPEASVTYYQIRRKASRLTK
ncbi:MAG: LysR family transcriptional regulator [Muribaculum sp.]|nr:LysR family transcriptional regulator [Muribaculum sp.]